MPRSLVRRAEEVLATLESARAEEPAKSQVNLTGLAATDEGIQMSFFQLDDPALESIRDQIMEVDIDQLTPVQALMRLHEIKATLTGKKSGEALNA